jgi:hypothetical protein
MAPPIRWQHSHMKLLQRKAPSVTHFSLPLAPSALFEMWWGAALLPD